MKIINAMVYEICADGKEMCKCWRPRVQGRDINIFIVVIERGRPKRRWLDKVKDDIKEKGLSVDDVYDRATWRRMPSYIGPT